MHCFELKPGHFLRLKVALSEVPTDAAKMGEAWSAGFVETGRCGTSMVSADSVLPHLRNSRDFFVSTRPASFVGKRSAQTVDGHKAKVVANQAS